MLSRNQIRQTALQYLYGASQSPEITGEQEEGIWDILMDPSGRTTASSGESRFRPPYA